MSSPLADLAGRLSKRIAPEVDKLRRKKIFVYDPIEYARAPHFDYLSKYASRCGLVLLLGMNPGPWGMAQTGVPFGAINRVRWLGVKGEIKQPEHPHPQLPVLGWDCQRNEISGDRLWGLLKQLYRSADRLSEQVTVLNYCPLLLFEQSGKRCRNLPLNKLGASMPRLLEACNEHLAAALEELKPALAIGVGGWAAKQLLAVAPSGLEVGQILHPSPASPAANRGFAEQATKQLRSLGVVAA